MVKGDIAECLATGDANRGFKSFVQTCLSDQEIANTGNVISAEELKNLFIDEQAQSASLLVSLQGIADLRTQGGLTADQLTSQNHDLTNTVIDLQNQIAEVANKIEVANQTFLQKAVNEPKESSFLGNLQDISLGAFFLSLIVLGVILAILQLFNPNNSITNRFGGLLAAFYTLLASLIILIVVYALLLEVA